eukprot:bmy_09799T0
MELTWLFTAGLTRVLTCGESIIKRIVGIIDPTKDFSSPVLTSQQKSVLAIILSCSYQGFEGEIMLQASTSGKGNSHSYIIQSSPQPFPSIPLTPTDFKAVKFLQLVGAKWYLHLNWILESLYLLWQQVFLPSSFSLF